MRRRRSSSVAPANGLEPDVSWAPVDSHLDRELAKLVLGTNDQRRRVGQAVYHLYRTLIFWHDKRRPFHASVQAWSVGGAAIFESLAAMLEGLDPFEEDAKLRAWLAIVLAQLGDDLRRGDHMLVPFLRWMEGRFGELTRMMQEESAGSTIYDFALARILEELFARAAGADRLGMADLFEGASRRIVSPVRRASPRA